MINFEDKIEAAKTSAWLWNLDAIRVAQNQLQELRKTGGVFRAKDIYGREQSCTVEKDKYRNGVNEQIETSGLRFLPIQMCGISDRPQSQADLLGGENCPIWVEEIIRDQDCRAENHVAEMDYQKNLIGAAVTSDTFQRVLDYLKEHAKIAQEITNVVCFGITDDDHKDILDHREDREIFRARSYVRYLMCSYISKTLRDVLRENNKDLGRELRMYIQGHIRCRQERHRLETGFRPEEAAASEQEGARRAHEAALAKASATRVVIGGYPADPLEDAGGLLQLNKSTFIVSFDERVPIRQMSAQALANDGGPAGMLCLEIADDSTAADCQNNEGRSWDLSIPELEEWKARCFESLNLPDQEPRFNVEDRDLFRNMKVYLKKRQSS